MPQETRDMFHRIRPPVGGRLGKRGRLSYLLLLGLVGLAVGCNPSPRPGTSPATGASPIAATATPATAATTPPTPSPTAPRPTGWPPVPDDDVEELPPIARLLLADGTVVAGALGGFDYRDTFSSVPWIGAAALEQVSASDRRPLTVALLPGYAFDRWSASYAAANDPGADVVMPLGAGAGDRLEQATFEPPPAGNWVIEVQLTFADDGGAAFYWRLIVP